MDLNYKKLGNSTDATLIILHGLFGSLDNWMTLARKFSEDCCVYIVDARNHGQSPWSDTFNYQVMAEDVYEFIHKHNIKQPIVLGHSMGGKTAMQLAMNHPEVLSKLIVADIAPKAYPVHHQLIIDALKSLNFDTIKSRKEADKQLAKYIDNFAIRQFLLKNLYWKEKDKLALRFNLEVIDKNIEIIGENLQNEHSFDKPSLFLRGGLSNYITKDDFKNIYDIFPQAKIISFDKVGHWLHAEAPEKFYNNVLSFIRE